MAEELQTNNNTQPDPNQTDTPKQVEEVKPGTSDRTKEQFSKLTDSNTALNAENDQLRQQLITARKPKGNTPASLPKVIPADINLDSFVESDPKTGERYLNETKLQKAMTDLKSQTTGVKTTIQSYIKTNEDRRIRQQKDVAFTAYPELQPDSKKFDKKFYKATRAVLYDSMMNANEYGKTLSLKEAADYVKNEFVSIPISEKGKGEKEDKKVTDSVKAQAGVLIPSQPQNAPQSTISDELKRLRLATRKGSTEALAQRILATDHVLKQES